MNSHITAAFSVSAFIFTAACGGGSTSDPTTVSFAALDSAADAFIGTYLTDNGSVVTGLDRATDFSSAASGGATYDGQFRGTVNGDGLLGDISLDVAFATGAVTGTGTSFQNEADGSYAGTLTGTGAFDGDAVSSFPQLTLILRGTLTDAVSANETEIALDGDFFANGADATGAVAGLAEGSLGADPIVDGVFAAER